MDDFSFFEKAEEIVDNKIKRKSVLPKSLENLKNSAKTQNDICFIYENLSLLTSYLSDPILFNNFNCKFQSDPEDVQEVNLIRPKRTPKINSVSSKEYLSELEQITGRKLSKPDLIDLANRISPLVGYFPSREERRNKDLLLIWFHTHLDEFTPKIREVLQE